jgi:Family of unknown function (DUF6502)
MKRVSPKSPTAAPSATARPSAANAELALREAETLMAPVAQWLLRSGVSFPAFSELLKQVFLKAAVQELQHGETQPTQSALSLLSGVHRKDVRAILEAPESNRAVPRPSTSSQVFTRWLTDRRFRAADGKPRRLLRAGERRSFESLCREFSNDVHPRTVLDELLRLGHVGIDGEYVVVLADAFVPAPHLDEITALFTSNASDHMAAAVANITQDGPKFLEQSIYADGLTAESIALLHDTAREAWAQAFEAVVTRAHDRVGHDAESDGDLRMRFGTYFFSEPARAPVVPADTAAAKRKVKSRQPATTRKKT